MNKINLSIITPQRLIYSDNIDMLTIPGSDGEFAILPGHISIISMLKAGIVNIYENNLITRSFYLSSGFLENDGVNCNILTEESFDMNHLTYEQIENMIKELELKQSDNLPNVSNQIHLLENIKLKIEKIN